MFACAHPAIDPKVRAPLMLQTVLGLDARRIASVYLRSPATLGQQLTRAKRKIAQAQIRFAAPADRDGYGARIDDILAAIYAAYAVGHNGSGAGDDKAGALAQEALWLVSTVCAALPEAAEAHGLFALILFTEARAPARIDPATGALVPLAKQDVALWNAQMLADAERALGNAQRRLSLGRFQIEAAIQAVHADRRHSGETNWAELATLYQGLAAIAPSLGALTGQAAVTIEAEGPEAALAQLLAIQDRGVDYQPWHATYASALHRLDRREAAHDAYAIAIGLCHDPAARAYLLRRQARLRI
jgi:RNA polymerase sigma-70 factor (ECF subfamily)